MESVQSMEHGQVRTQARPSAGTGPAMPGVPFLTSAVLCCFLLCSLGRDYPGPTPDPHLAAGSLCIVLKPEPLIALMMFRIENKSTEVWDGIDTAGAHSSKEAQPPGRASPSTSGVLTLAERTARNTRSVFAAQFLRAYRLSTHGSCAPWPINAHPLLQIITNVMIDHFEAHDSLKFFSANLQNLCQTVEPENTLPSRILREEMDGVLLLSRSSARSRPIAGLSDAMEERGGLGDAKPSDHVICVNQGWCEIFGFIDETADLRDKDIEKSLMTTGVPLEEIMHPLFDTSRTITVWSKKKGHTTLSFRCFHVFSVQHEEEFHEVLAFTFTDVTIQQRVEQALLLAHQQSRRSEQAKQSMIGMVSHELRTPLTAILGFSEILASDMRLSHEQREFVADIHSAGSHLLSIITNLLDLTKFELSDSKKTVCHKTPQTNDLLVLLDRSRSTLNCLVPPLLQPPPPPSRKAPGTSITVPAADAIVLCALCVCLCLCVCARHPSRCPCSSLSISC